MDGIAPVSTQFSVRPLREAPAVDNSETKNLATRAGEALSELSRNSDQDAKKMASSFELNDLSPGKLIEYQEYTRRKQLAIQVVKNITSETVSGLKTLTQQ